jgi:hypothetical protein
MDLCSFRQLQTSLGQEVLNAAEALAPREQDYLQHFQFLTRQYPTGLAQAALETAILRLEARFKFPDADRMYFTRQAMEQASSYDVSEYRSERYKTFQVVTDLGCSIGGDTLSLAKVANTIGIDLDPLRLAVARANVKALGVAGAACFLQADLCSPLPLSSKGFRRGMALFFDPARRDDWRRIYSTHEYIPPLDVVKDWLPSFPALGVKISPGVDLGELQGYQAEVEFISLQGELKEAVLWFGPLKTTNRRATILPGKHTLTAAEGAELPLDEPHAYLYEPDPAVLRAGLVTTLGLQLDAAQLDATIAYLTADERIETPFARAWQVVDWFPFGLKRLRSYLREQRVGQVVVKKRGSPLQPDAIIRALRLRGDQERVIFLTKLRGKPIVVVCLPR